MSCQHLKIRIEHTKIWISVFLEKFRISSNAGSSFLCDNIHKYHQEAAVPFRQSDPLQFSADSIIPYDSCKHQPCSFSLPVKPLQTSAFKAPTRAIKNSLLLAELSCPHSVVGIVPSHRWTHLPCHIPSPINSQCLYQYFLFLAGGEKKTSNI